MEEQDIRRINGAWKCKAIQSNELSNVTYAAASFTSAAFPARWAPQNVGSGFPLLRQEVGISEHLLQEADDRQLQLAVHLKVLDISTMSSSGGEKEKLTEVETEPPLALPDMDFLLFIFSYTGIFI